MDTSRVPRCPVRHSGGLRRQRGDSRSASGTRADGPVRNIRHGRGAATAIHGTRHTRPTARAGPTGIPSSPGFQRGWIDINIGAAIAAEDEFRTELTAPLCQEIATFRATYRNPTGAAVDIGGGVMLTPEFGVGMTVSGTAHAESTDLFASIPHPTSFNANATDEFTTADTLTRAEGAIHLQVVGVAPLGDRARLRVFAGPTYFRVQQDLVSDVRYTQSFVFLSRVNAVDIASAEIDEKVEATAWGFHVGGDLSLFFNRVIGIGAYARYSRGSVDVEEPLGETAVELKAGGVQAGLGLRLRF